jgi:HSP20 family protein
VYRENFGNTRWGHLNETFWRPPTDVYETDDSIVVLVEIAGLSPQDYAITLNARILTVTGERRSPEGKLAYQQMEIRHGKFRAEVHLPWPLEGAGQTATYENGFLKITLPKAQVRRVLVQTAETTDKEQ